MGRRIKIAGKKIKLDPLPAKESLRMVIKFSAFIHDTAPELAILADPSRQVRVATLLKIIKEKEELPDLLFELASTASGIPVETLEDDATLHELLVLVSKIIRINDWDKIWTGAMRLRIIDTSNLYDWLWARITSLRVR